jgi:hypothetical protein
MTTGKPSVCFEFRQTSLQMAESLTCCLPLDAAEYDAAFIKNQCSREAIKREALRTDAPLAI